MAKQQLVLAFFENEAAKEIKQWERGNKDFEFGAIGVLVKDDKGKIKTHKLGKRKTGTGVALFALAGLLSGGITVVGGAIAGGIIGTFFHKGLGMSKEDLTKIDEELDGGEGVLSLTTSP